MPGVIGSVCPTNICNGVDQQSLTANQSNQMSLMSSCWCCCLWWWWWWCWWWRRFKKL